LATDAGGHGKKKNADARHGGAPHGRLSLKDRGALELFESRTSGVDAAERTVDQPKRPVT
jgi:hypothetical protein